MRFDRPKRWDRRQGVPGVPGAGDPKSSECPSGACCGPHRAIRVDVIEGE
jgi:hypothetical protein